MAEDKKTRMMMVAFLLVIVVVSALVLWSLFKAQSGRL